MPYRQYPSFVSIVLAFATVVAFDTSAQAELFKLSSSAGASKKAHRFIQAVEVSPSRFAWNDNEVEVQDCWIERAPNGAQFLLFKLNINGKSDQEHRIANETKNFLSFVQIGDKPLIGHPSFFRHLPLHNAPKSVFGTFGEYVHYVELKEAAQMNLKLQVATHHFQDNNPTLSPTVLTFQIDNRNERGD